MLTTVSEGALLVLSTPLHIFPITGYFSTLGYYTYMYLSYSFMNGVASKLTPFAFTTILILWHDLSYLQ